MKMFFIYALLIQCYFLFVASITICSSAKWSKTATTVSGTGISGNSADQFNWPHGIFIHKHSNTLYVADSDNNRIQMFNLNEPSTTGTTVARDVSDPTAIYIDDDHDGRVMYISLEGSNRVEKWINGVTSGMQVGDTCRVCAGVWLDNEKNVYMAEAARFRVVKWVPSTNITTVVAGQTDKYGSTDDLLNIAGNVYVHPTDGTIYVADRINNRIQKWPKDASRGITVAGSNNGTDGNDNASLSDPFGVLVDDQTGVIYVADTFNDRIQRWLPNAVQGDTIAGGFGTGNASNQLKGPTSLAFDNKGNLYVSDSLNHRIQKFMLIENPPCSPTSSGNLLIYRLATIIMPFLSLTWFIIELI